MRSAFINLFFSFCTCAVLAYGNPLLRNTKLSSSEELSSMFYTSIVFWDFDDFDYVTPPMKSQMKEEIMQELSHLTDDSEQCRCPRNLGTKVCDNSGILYPNICKFHCAFAKHVDDVKPKMILTDTPFSVSRQMCTQKFKSSNDN